MYDIRGHAVRSLGPRFRTQVPGDLGHELDADHALGANRRDDKPAGPVLTIGTFF